ncbi:MAG TPA: hypothetical protein VJ577_05365 [Burkholderiaceae bacterium]|nr:hypothetical protein [Burkholderiaceae bacterium]
MSQKKNSRLWSRLRVLCCAGLDLMSITPDAFAIVHELIPNAASALFLTSHDGVPQGFYHEDSPDEAQNLFLNEPQLFIGPDEYNVLRLVGTPGAVKIGQLLQPPQEFFKSNTYQLLVRASGHHHTLDARLEVDGRRAGLITLYREAGIRFSLQDADDLARVAIHFEHALRIGTASPHQPADIVEHEAIIVAHTDGKPLFISQAANALLAAIPLVGPQWPDRRKLPLFCERLIEILQDGERHPWTMPSHTIPLPGGALHVSAQWLCAAGAESPVGAVAASESGLVGISLKQSTPTPLRVWRNLNKAALSPQQMEVAFWMALGGGRDAARARMPISEAVLRDCVKSVYETLGCASQEEMINVLLAAPQTSVSIQ